MEEAILYLLKSAGLLSLFYAGYFFLLKNDTSFKTNRYFLLAGILTSTFLPFLKFKRTIQMEYPNNTFFPNQFSAEAFNAAVTQPKAFDLWEIAGIVYLAGLSFFLLKFFLELFSLLKIMRTEKVVRKNGYNLIYKPGCTQPFSFFRYIVFDPEQHSVMETALILKHEQAHVRQWHSIDQLLSSLGVCLLWFNPLSWLYRRNLVQNLEYLADREVLSSEFSKTEYQKTLLKISIGSFKPSFTNQFYQSFIKKRIIMLNRQNSQKLNPWKAYVILPFLALFVLLFHVETKAHIKNSPSLETILPLQTLDLDSSAMHSNAEPSLNTYASDGPGVTSKSEINSELQEKSPLIIVNGEIKDEDYNMREIDPATIKTLTVLKAESAIEKYGEKGRNAAIEIILKSEDEQKSTSKQSKEGTVKIRLATPNTDSSEEKTTTIVVSEGTINQDLPKNILYIVDGKRVEKFDADSIAPEDIESVNILKGDKAITEYGKEASNGVIIINLKK